MIFCQLKSKPKNTKKRTIKKQYNTPETTEKASTYISYLSTNFLLKKGVFTLIKANFISYF